MIDSEGRLFSAFATEARATRARTIENFRSEQPNIQNAVSEPMTALSTNGTAQFGPVARTIPEDGTRNPADKLVTDAHDIADHRAVLDDLDHEISNVGA